MSLLPTPPPGPLALTLRPYQQEAVDSLYDWFRKHDGNPLIVVPTGGGKSLIIAGFVHSVLSQWPGERILVLTHVRELIAQNHRQMLRCWPGAPAGIYSAGLGRREHDAPILFAGIQSVYQKAERIGWADLVIVDEAHLIPKSGMGMYRTFLDAMRSMNSDLKVIGLTATPFRTGDGALDRGDDRLFHGVAYDCNLVELINGGYLSPVTHKATVASIDTAGLHVRAGDFVESELEAAALAGDNVPAACREIVARGADRRSWLVFCCSIAHALAVAEQLHGHGVSVATVFGDTPKDERDATVEAFRAGRIRCVVNVNVLTTGFDAPELDLIALLRPTMSAVLFVQMVGRGLRTAEGKKNCLVLDFGGNVMRHGPIDAIRIREPKKGTPGGMLARECPVCQTLVSIACRQCPECGFEWVIADGESGSKHADKPAEDEIIAGLAPRKPIETWRVNHSHFSYHQKEGKLPTLCAEYTGGLNQRVREWVCFEHTGFPRRKAEAWWRDRGGNHPCPSTVAEAECRIEAGELRDVTEVVVDTRGEWPEIRGARLTRKPGADDGFVSGPVSLPTDSELPF